MPEESARIVLYAITACGFLVWLAGFTMMQVYVVGSDDPAVRGQTFQMVQCVHFLWPPFLIGGLYRARVRTIRVRLENLIRNLAFA